MGLLRVRNPDRMRQGFCDHIAELMFELLFNVATIKGGGDFSVWHLQHNIAWDETLGYGDGPGRARKAVAFKLRRLLYNEIRELEKFPHYKSARILGLCLYVMGFSTLKRSDIDRYYRPLDKVVIRWTKRNYLRLMHVNPDVAAACLIGSVSFDSANRRLVKTYTKGLEREVPKRYLELDAFEEADGPAGETG